MRNKICSKCRNAKSADEFTPSTYTKDKLQSQCRECKRGYYTPDPVKARENHLKWAFGITSRDYNEMLEKQGGGCGICGKTPEENGKVLAVDHDHTTGLVRALLCNFCNTGLGMFLDDPELMEAAADYIRRFEFQVKIQEV